MKLTKTNLKKYRRNQTKLIKFAIDYVLYKYEEYENKENIIKEVLEHGLDLKKSCID